MPDQCRRDYNISERPRRVPDDANNSEPSDSGEGWLYSKGDRSAYPTH